MRDVCIVELFTFCLWVESEESFSLFHPFWSLRMQRVESRDLEAPDCARALEFR